MVELCEGPYLIVAVLDPVQVQHGEGVGADEAGERQDLVHLDRRHLPYRKRSGEQRKEARTWDWESPTS